MVPERRRRRTHVLLLGLPLLLALRDVLRCIPVRMDPSVRELGMPGTSSSMVDIPHM
jgi:hypothetical protein